MKALKTFRRPYPYAPNHSTAMPYPFRRTLSEKVFENIAISKAMYERQKLGHDLGDIEVPDYPQLREFLKDLSYPPLWEAMQEGAKDDLFFWRIIEKMGFKESIASKNARHITLKLQVSWRCSTRITLNKPDFQPLLFSCIHMMVR